MDPAVVAAVITTPTAVIAAVAAYVAGSAQARAAHRGPVDAVRRQHQREAYAALVIEASKYEKHMFREYIETISPRMRHHRNGILAGPDASEALLFAVAAVRLEGPAHLAELAHRIERASNHVFGAVLTLQATDDPTATSPEDLRQFDERHNILKDRERAFVEAASAHLNGARSLPLRLRRATRPSAHRPARAR
ncbi:hypothetical protein [Streptomyces sp. NPDC048560]|uniref:hypothetical protein n=1 Tax=Streptomyces sp. NPDC048560 TaxID=3155488 RepID=UPI00343D3501